MTQSNTVRSIGEALERANEYPDAVGYFVASLSTRHGGARKWFGLHPKEKRWMSETERKEDIEPAIPHPDDGVENLPPLPPSKVNLWELAFIRPKGNDLEFIRPRILIDPSYGEAETTATEEQPAMSMPVSEAGGLNGHVVAMLKEQHRFTLDMLKTTKELVASVGNEQRQLTATYKEELALSQARARESDKIRDEALVENAKWATQVAELKSDNQVAQTIGQIFAGKPELLVESVGKLAMGLIQALQGKAAAAA